jgi:hypothetical protein
MFRFPRLPAALAAVLFALASPVLPALPAQDEARVLAAFQKAFTPPPKGKATLDEKRAALDATRDLDSAKAAEVIVDGWLDVATELAQIDADRDAKNQEIAEIQKGQEASDHRTFEQKTFERHKQLQAEVTELRTRADGLRELQAKASARVTAFKKRDSVLFLLQRVVGSKKHPLPLKLAAARAVGAAAADVMEDLAAALPRAKQVDEQIVLLDAMATAGRIAAPHATPVIALLDSKEEAVAERAAAALAKLAVPEAIAPMIELMSRIEGQARVRIGGSLEVLTDQHFGSNVSMWRAWWQQDGQMFVASGKQLGNGKPSSPVKDANGRYYFGIPQQDSKSILYVIDCSGSMTAEIDWHGKNGEAVKTTRIDACKFELVRALGQLRPAQKFGILWFNDQPHFWEPKMLDASKDNVAHAQAFVDTLKPASSTNIHDSLQQCFKLVGRGAHDKYYGTELDTIFLMTDGSPTTNDGKLDSTDKILVGVRSWNPLKRVTIHCIAMGKDLNEQFLRQLAEENGGEFKQF